MRSLKEEGGQSNSISSATTPVMFNAHFTIKLMKDIEQHSMVIFVNNNILDNGTGITIHYIKLFKSTSRLRAKGKIGHYSMSALNQAKNQSSHNVPNQAKI
jgi:hypothetical protein